jgi:hypothetical protein
LDVESLIKMNLYELDHVLTEAEMTKQQVIQYFVGRGRTAAEGAAAYERGYRGPKPAAKKPEPGILGGVKPPSRPPVKHWQDVDEDQGRVNAAEFVQKRLPWLQKELGLKDLPRINFLDRPTTTAFGHYDPEIKELFLVTAGRHPVDVLRTLAHELTHYRQDIEGKLEPGAGETGTPQENEANSTAGVVMRNFAQENPQEFGLNETAGPGSLLRSAGKKKGELINNSDLLRLKGRSTKMRKSNNRMIRERGLQLQRQLTWYKNFHKKKSQAVGSK